MKVVTLTLLLSVVLQVSAQTNPSPYPIGDTTLVLFPNEPIPIEGYKPMGRDVFDYSLPYSQIPTVPTGEVGWDSLATIIPNGSLTYKNGLLEGTVKGYWTNGNVQFEITFHQGAMQGIVRQYYETGVLFIEAQMMEEVKNNPHFGIESSKQSGYVTILGERITEHSYTEADSKHRMGVYEVETTSPPYHGYYRCYWPNGNLMEDSDYVHGGKSGYSFYYKEDGSFEGFEYHTVRPYFSCIGYMQPDGTIKMLSVPEE